MAERVETIGKAIDPKSPESLRAALSTLHLIIEDLQSMVSLGGQVQDESKRGLMLEVHALLKQTMTLKAHLDRAIAIQPTIQAASDAVAKASLPGSAAAVGASWPNAQPRPSLSTLENQVLRDQGPLTREEISKLLLITCRAWKSKMLSDKQRHFIKQVIVRREGYLRVVLTLGSIGQTLEALLAVGGSDDEEDDEDEQDVDDEDDVEDSVYEED